MANRYLPTTRNHLTTIPSNKARRSPFDVLPVYEVWMRPCVTLCSQGLWQHLVGTWHHGGMQPQSDLALQSASQEPDATFQASG